MLRSGDSADEAAAVAKGSVPGAPGEHLTQEANEATAEGSGHGAPGEQLALVLGVVPAAAMTTTKDLAGSKLAGQR